MNINILTAYVKSLKYVVILWACAPFGNLIAQNATLTHCEYLKEFNVGNVKADVLNVSYNIKRVDNTIQALYYDPFTYKPLQFLVFSLISKEMITRVAFSENLPINDIFDFSWKDGFFYFSTSNAIIKLENNKQLDTLYISTNPRIIALRLENLTKNKILAYNIYNYHPYAHHESNTNYDKQKPGLYAFIVDVKSGNTVSQWRYFTGISISNMVQDWVFATENKVFIAKPFSGQVLIADTNFYVFDSIEFPNSYDFNIGESLAKINDRIKENEDRELLSLRDSGIQHNLEVTSDFYTKEAIFQKIDSIRNTSTYIERILNCGDSIMGIVLYSYKLGKEFRTLHLLNYTTKELLPIKFYFPNTSQRSGKSLAAFDIPDFANSYGFGPIINDRIIYYMSDASYQLLSFPSNREVLEKVLYLKSKNRNTKTIKKCEFFY